MIWAPTFDKDSVKTNYKLHEHRLTILTNTLAESGTIERGITVLLAFRVAVMKYLEGGKF